MKKILLLSTAIIAIVSTIALAQQARPNRNKSTIKPIDTLFKHLEVKEILSKTVIAEIKKGTDHIKTKDDKALEEAVHKITKHLTSDKFINELKAIYIEHMTTQVVEKVVYFYQSETYKKFSTALPKIQSEISKKIYQESQPFMDQLSQSLILKK